MNARNNVQPMYSPQPKLPFNHPALVAARKRKNWEYRRHLIKKGVIKEAQS